MADKALALLKVIRKIPMFHGLSADGTRLVLQSCEFRGVRSGESVCRVNAQSDEMYILLSGQLGVYNEDQILLASINPVAPVGDMGLIIGQLRSATVDALRECNMLILRKVAFDRLLRSNAQLCTQVYSSVIETMAQRLAASRIEQQLARQRWAVLEQKLTQGEAQVAALSPGGAV